MSTLCIAAHSPACSAREGGDAVTIHNTLQNAVLITESAKDRALALMRSDLFERGLHGSTIHQQLITVLDELEEVQEDVLSGYVTAERVAELMGHKTRSVRQRWKKLRELHLRPACQQSRRR